MSDQQSYGKYQNFGVCGNITMGLKVWASEMNWLFKKLLRKMELRQLKKRLAAERQRLGELVSSAGNDAQVELCRDQAKFLEREILRLSEGLEQDRKRYVEERLLKWGL